MEIIEYIRSLVNAFFVFIENNSSTRTKIEAATKRLLFSFSVQSRLNKNIKTRVTYDFFYDLFWLF
jgi:hypothetical protein